MSRRCQFLIAALFGCSSEPVELEPAPQAPRFVPAAEAITFDLVPQRGAPVVRRLAITNEGTAQLELELVLEGPAAALFELTETSISVLPGATREAVLTLTPGLPGELEVILSIQTNDPARPSATVPVTATVVPSCLGDDRDLSPFAYHETRAVELRASPACSIVDVEFSHPDFVLVDAPDLPAAIAEGESSELLVQNVRTREPEPRARMTVGASDGSTVRIGLVGEPPVRDCLSDPVPLPFGPVRIGSRRVVSVVVRNSCDAPLTLASAALPSPVFSVVTPLPVRIERGAPLDLELAYEPVVPGRSDAGTISFQTNDLRTPRLGYQVSGRAARFAAELAPTRLDLEEAAEGCASRTRAARLFNDGDLPLTVEAVEVDGDEFELVEITRGGAPVVAPFEVAPGEPAALHVRYAGGAAPASLESVIRVHVLGEDVPLESRLLVEVVETGTTSERFEAAPPPVDLLWVLDTTRSMVDERARLSAGLPALFAELSPDYRIALTTFGDPEAVGRLEHCPEYPAILTGADDGRAALECLLEGPSQTTEGGAFRGAAEALAGAGFVRQDARLVLLFTSDADETSSMRNDTFLGVLEATKNDRASRLQVHAIAGPVVEMCANGQGAADPGFRYRHVAMNTDGFFFSICEQNLGTWLGAIARATSAPLRDWTIAGPADPSSLVVRVGARVLPSGAYTFDEATGVLEIDEPEPIDGAVTVEYLRSCP